MLNKKPVRVAIGILILLVVAYSTVPYIYRYNSIDGVVNGRIAVLRTPIQGMIEFSKETRYGSVFKKGELIATILNERVDRVTLHGLEVERKTLEGRVAALNARIDSLAKLKDSLSTSTDNYKNFAIKQIQFQIEQEGHKLNQEKAECVRAQKEMDAGVMLDERNIVSKRDLDKYEANLRSSKERIFQIENRLKELSNSLDAVKGGAFLGDGHNDSPYSKQRIDQFAAEISQAEAARAEAMSRIPALSLQIKAEEERIAKAEKFEIKAPFDALVWRMPASPGCILNPDAEAIILLECASVFLDISVSETQFSNIAPGDKIAYRLIGAKKSYFGKAVALRGSGSVMGDMSLAAEMRIDPKKHFRVWIKAAPNDLDLTPENFFQIGRRVEAKLARRWSLENFFSNMLDVF